MLKVFIISEELSGPFDEGIKNFAYNLSRELSKSNDVLTISIRGNKTDERYIKRLNVNKTFLSYPLFKEIRHFRPAIILYVSSPSATLFSFMRTKVLKSYAKRAKVVMIALQPREYSLLSRKLIRLLIPDLILVQSPRVLRQLSKLDCRVKFIPTGVGLEKFHPVTKERKLELRNKYGIDADKFTILHVGHINRNRNIQILKELQRDNNQIVIVGSTSTEQDKDLVDELRIAGVRVITEYLDSIEEIYQLSDCYIFPVTSETASTEVPLSVLEAMACNLPVITTKYGGLPNIFDKGEGFFYINNLDNIYDRIETVRGLKGIKTREMVKLFSWKDVVRRLILELE